MSEVFTALRVETPHQEVDRKISELKQIADRREKLLRLLQNSDFKSLIMQFYLVEEAARMAQFSAQLGVSLQDRQDAMAMAQATGHLKRFLDVVERQGEHAVKELAEYSLHYDELIRGDE